MLLVLLMQLLLLFAAAVAVYLVSSGACCLAALHGVILWGLARVIGSNRSQNSLGATEVYHAFDTTISERIIT